MESDPVNPEMPSVAPAEPRPVALAEIDEFDLWRDVFVQQKLPWGRFVQSALLHTAALALIWAVSISWIRQQKILNHPAFDRASLVTYSPEEYLPPIDTGAAELPKVQKGDPVYAKQPILSVPPEADNRSQTIVVPPDLKLDHDVPLPNLVATGAVAPMVPLDAAPAQLSRRAAPDVPDVQVVAPAPDVALTRSRESQPALKSDVIAPPPEVTQTEVSRSTKGRVGPMNIGTVDVVAPAPQLTMAEQHTLAARGGGRAPGGGIQPVAPPPSVAAGNGVASGRLIALGIHPVAPTGPVPVPAGNRRGTFAATPQGKPGASGTPELTGSKSAGGLSAHKNGSLPSGLHVGGADADDPREVASAGAKSGGSNARVASPVSDDKITDLDRKVFGGKRVYGRTLNMPNLNSSTGSWVIKFAELNGDRRDKDKDGDLLEPVAMEKSDPGYPLELMRSNVHGLVTLYAVIHSDGKVGDIRVLSSPDERLDDYAAKALARWKFVPGERAGKPVALEAVVEIPFRVRRSF
ncbi:MAG: energy transducer TonB [Terriglobales bacterium]